MFYKCKFSILPGLILQIYFCKFCYNLLPPPPPPHHAIKCPSRVSNHSVMLLKSLGKLNHILLILGLLEANTAPIYSAIREQDLI